MYTDYAYDKKTILTASGYAKEGYCSINMADIYSQLIATAGRYCKRFSSDILYSIKAIQNAIVSGIEQHSDFYFAFRENGVDSDEFIECRLAQDSTYQYKSMWKLELQITPDKYGDESRVSCTFGKLRQTV